MPSRGIHFPGEHPPPGMEWCMFGVKSTFQLIWRASYNSIIGGSTNAVEASICCGFHSDLSPVLFRKVQIALDFCGESLEIGPMKNRVKQIMWPSKYKQQRWREVQNSLHGLWNCRISPNRGKGFWILFAVINMRLYSFHSTNFEMLTKQNEPVCSASFGMPWKLKSLGKFQQHLWFLNSLSF